MPTSNDERLVNRTSLRVASLTFITEKDHPPHAAQMLRGYLGNLYREEDLFHNHIDESKVIYRMPLIQYHVIGGKLTVIGINEGVAPLSEKFLHLKELQLGEERLRCFETSIEVRDELFSVEDELYSYRFITPWIALSQKNHHRFRKGEIDLNRMAQNNLLSNFKGLGVQVESRILVKGEFKPLARELYFKGTRTIGFEGSFVTNVRIPDYMALGKHRAVGYGAVVSI